MTGQTDSVTPLHPRPGGTPANPARAFREAVAEIVPLRGWRLHQLAEALTARVDRELAESDAGLHDDEARALLNRKYLQGLADALAGTGPYAVQPRPAELLAIRYADRDAFERYGRVHARLTRLAAEGGTEAVTLPEMLLALRLRMLCLDWAAISLVFGALKRPCDEAALRKRQSRLIELASSDVSGAEDWAGIDAYLKARRRSFGGTRRRNPLVPIIAALVMLAALGALALSVWRARAPAAPVQTAPAKPAVVPRDHDELKVPPVVPQTSLPSSTPPGEETTTASAPAPVEEPASLFFEPLDPKGGAWQHDRGNTTEIAWREVAGGGWEIEGATIVHAPPSVVRKVLLDAAGYPTFMPHLTDSTSTGPERALVETWSWHTGLPVIEAVRVLGLSDFAIRVAMWHRVSRTLGSQRIPDDDQMEWRLKNEGSSTAIVFRRTIGRYTWASAPAHEDVRPMLERLRTKIESLPAQPPDPPVIVGLFDLDRILSRTPLVAQERESLRSLNERDRERLADLSKQIGHISYTLADSLTPEARAGLEQQLKDDRTLERELTLAVRSNDDEMDELFGALLKLAPIVREVGRAEGATLVARPTEPSLIDGPTKDITNAVLRRF